MSQKQQEKSEQTESMIDLVERSYPVYIAPVVSVLLLCAYGVKGRIASATLHFPKRNLASYGAVDSLFQIGLQSVVF